MEEKPKLESVIQNIRTNLEARWELFLLKTSDKASEIISSIAAVVLITASLLFVLLFLSIGAALWIGRAYGDFSIGFLFVGLFYLLVSLILFFFRRTLIKLPVINNLLAAFYNEEDK